MGLLLSVALAFLVAWLLVKPHVDAQETALSYGGNVPQAGLQGLFDQKQRCIQLTKDLDLDYSTGKIAKPDYDRMRDTLTAELAGLLTQIDGQTGKRS